MKNRCHCKPYSRQEKQYVLYCNIHMKTLCLNVLLYFPGCVDNHSRGILLYLFWKLFVYCWERRQLLKGVNKQCSHKTLHWNMEFTAARDNCKHNQVESVWPLRPYIHVQYIQEILLLSFLAGFSTQFDHVSIKRHF